MGIDSGTGGETAARVGAGTRAGVAIREGEPVAREMSVESREVVEGSDAEDGSAEGGDALSPEVAGAA